LFFNPFYPHWSQNISKIFGFPPANSNPWKPGLCVKLRNIQHIIVGGAYLKRPGQLEGKRYLIVVDGVFCNEGEGLLSNLGLPPIDKEQVKNKTGKNKWINA
ncbi:hypothetical protein KI387_011512, partial [Taxus chinensis]